VSEGGKIPPPSPLSSEDRIAFTTPPYWEVAMHYLRQAIRDADATGMPRQQIADLLGVSRQTVYDVLGEGSS
jgi:predicted DNA-binding protein (UPF0251 family)